MRSRHDGHRINITLPTDAFACLEFLAEQRRFGTSPPDVASYLILVAIQQFMELGWLQKEPFGSREKQEATAHRADKRRAG